MNEIVVFGGLVFHSIVMFLAIWWIGDDLKQMINTMMAKLREDTMIDLQAMMEQAMTRWKEIRSE